jgi:hypothetical protein
MGGICGEKFKGCDMRILIVMGLGLEVVFGRVGCLK